MCSAWLSPLLWRFKSCSMLDEELSIIVQAEQSLWDMILLTRFEQCSLCFGRCKITKRHTTIYKTACKTVAAFTSSRCLACLLSGRQSCLHNLWLRVHKLQQKMLTKSHICSETQKLMSRNHDQEDHHKFPLNICLHKSAKSRREQVLWLGPKKITHTYKVSQSQSFSKVKGLT